MMIETSTLLTKARELAENAGIDNVAFDRDMLVMGGIRYVVAACKCGDSECDGVQLQIASSHAGASLQ
ncbi:hypothetical protein [Sphingobium subterraneum]|uniref:Uncharacterized protein n=1 Tax=Sphingobium subterraneum TaxID=627688 RepID=A0A841J747_9SPHN|nr:hypothetical protein [Sphingobium subterraneum]MBB6124355.1 hypothetical protein [Sphingobium subterraneum]